jgi:PAS domain S-box-containing protein
MTTHMPKNDEAGIALASSDAPRFRLVIRACAAFTAAIGGVALLGWMTGRLEVASLGAGKVAMAPSTAFMFVMLAAAIRFISFTPRRVAAFTGLIVNAAVTLLSLILIFLASQGIHTALEHPGFTIIDSDGKTPAGHMSPITAICFLLASLSYLILLSAPTVRPRRAAAACLFAGVLIATNLLFALAYLYGTPLFYGGTFIPPAALTCMAFISLGTALLCLSLPHVSSSPQSTEPFTRSSYYILLVLSLLVLGIMMGGYLYFMNFERNYREEVGRNLTAIGSLKVAELESYYKERLSDAGIFFKNPSFAAITRRFLDNPGDAGAKAELSSWLDLYQDSIQYYRIFLLDVRGESRIFTLGTPTPIAAAVSRRVPEALRAGRITFVDFHRNEHDGKIYLAILAPIHDPQASNRPLGVIMLRIDPEAYLYPYIKRWPSDSKTSETLLVRRDGNDVLFLNDPRFSHNAALNMRFPLNQTDLPAVKAVLGEKGVVEGRDYRGSPVTAYVAPISGTPWFLVARTDTAETYAPLRERLWATAMFTVFMILSAGVTVALIWRKQRAIIVEDRFKASELLHLSEERFNNLFNQSPMGIALIDSLTGHIDAVNSVFARISGRTPEEMLQIDYMSITHPDDQQKEADLMSQMKTGDIKGFQMEKRYLHKDGTNAWINMTIAPVKVEDEQQPRHLCMIEEITIRKKYELELQQKNAELERFTYTVSHDLKSPIITIKGFTGSLEKDLEQGNYQRMAGDLKRVSDAADKMDCLLRDLLEISTIGRIINQSEPVDMNLLLDDVLAQLAGPLKNHNIAVTVQPGLPTVLCDRRRMAEVLQNLLENAINYMGDQAEPQILFGMREEAGENIFFVQDNGIGIDEKYHQIIFGLFNKLDAESDGTGIGLALVKRVIEVHGGRVWVESEGEGTGSRFCFSVPG